MVNDKHTSIKLIEMNFFKILPPLKLPFVYLLTYREYVQSKEEYSRGGAAARRGGKEEKTKRRIEGVNGVNRT
jgi:hypothetical protein